MWCKLGAWGDGMETVIYGMLQEEKQRNLRLQDTYKQEIGALRKGSIMRRNISGKNYYYLKYRENNKVRTDYIGKDLSIIEEVRRETEKRKYLQSVLKRLQLEYKQISLLVKD